VVAGSFHFKCCLRVSSGGMRYASALLPRAVGMHMDDTTKCLLIDFTIVCSGLLGLLWSASKWYILSTVELDGHPELKERQGPDEPCKTTDIVSEMNKISRAIRDGAKSFLFAEYSVMAGCIAGFSVVLFVCTGWVTTISFIVGATTSVLCGWIGMMVAVHANVRTAHECWRDLRSGFDVALCGGCVMGFSLVSIGILALLSLVLIVRLWFPSKAQQLVMFEDIAGYGLGASFVALFGRVGGGIYTKAADIGADLTGKNDYGLDEDSYLNPACIADNVGDNVGDIAGMGADLFGSFSEASCAALVLAADTPALSESRTAMMYPLLISACGIFVGGATLAIQSLLFQVREKPDVERALKGLLLISTVLMSPTIVLLSWACLPDTFHLRDSKGVHWWGCAVAALLGLWSGLVIGCVTEYYTSHSYAPVREIAETQRQSAATGIIYGLALGYSSCAVPVLAIGTTILGAYTCCGMLGVALGALGMLATMTMGLAIDAYGPISDNAGGIAQMAGLPAEVRERTDCLDAAGNTTAAVGKGFAIGSAALVSLALFGAFTVRARVTHALLLDPWVLTGLLLGAMLPYAFAALTMKAVGTAANDMVKECVRQFPKIMGPERMAPDYDRCIMISTQASLREMMQPSALVILSPIVVGCGFGKNACAGLLLGALVSSMQLAISMSNSGGAWDNAKKYITAGGLGPEYRKGSEAHKNSVIGDTVGDPLKDTSGPALNIVMKLSAIISLVFGDTIAHCSNIHGGPAWY